MRRSKVLAMLLSMVMLFCILPGSLARADSPSVDIHFDTEFVRDMFCGTTWFYANAGNIISGPYSNSDIDGYIHSAVDGAVLSSSMFAYTAVNDGNPEHRLMQVNYSCDDQSIFDAGASANVVVNGVPFSYYGFHDNCYDFTSSKVAGVSVLIGQGVVIVHFNTDFLGTVEMYRLYNPNSGEYFYTSNPAELDALIGLGWNDEGIGWYSGDVPKSPLYRQYNPNAFANNHNYTTSQD